MRVISFALTRGPVLRETKTQTRREGWEHARVGQRLRGVLKSQGRRADEPLVDLAVVEITAVRREVLQDISAADLDAEGFPATMIDSLEDRRDRFVALFPCERTAVITVIEFKYLNAEICERAAAGETLGDIAGWLDGVEPERAKAGTIEAVRAAITRGRKRGAA